MGNVWEFSRFYAVILTLAKSLTVGSSTATSAALGLAENLAEFASELILLRLTPRMRIAALRPSMIKGTLNRVQWREARQ